MYYNLSECTLEELQEIRCSLKDRQKDTDEKMYGDAKYDYNLLQRLADYRYSITREMCSVEDEIIRRRRKALNLASVAKDSGAIYIDISTKCFTNKVGRNAKMSLHGISL